LKTYTSAAPEVSISGVRQFFYKEEIFMLNRKQSFARLSRGFFLVINMLFIVVSWFAPGQIFAQVVSRVIKINDAAAKADKTLKFNGETIIMKSYGIGQTFGFTSKKPM
jgi:hypothetical protein